MIPAIGIMLGFYIMTRCISFFSRKGDRAESGVVLAFSAITIAVTIIVMIILLASGSTIR